MRVRSLPLVALFLAAGLSGCVGTETTDGDVATIPDVASILSYEFPQKVTGMEHLRQMSFTLPDGAEFKMVGNGIHLHKGYAYISGSSLVILDLKTDPGAPQAVAIVEDTRSRDVDIMEHPDGRVYAVLAGSPGIIMVDVTDPAAPVIAHKLTIGYHNLVVVENTTIVYNSRSLYTGPDLITEGGLLDIIDFANVTDPQVKQFRLQGPTMMGVPKVGKAPACHDVTTYPEVGRAYCAGVTETQVWDISDPWSPIILQIIDNPGTNIHHAAWPAKDHKVLVIGDELGGATAYPGCAVSDQPYGGLWFIDISDLAMPTPIGWYAPHEETKQNINCTSHFGGFVEDTDIMVMSWYTGGISLIDITDPADVKELARFSDGTNTWDAQYYAGHVFTGDQARGVDVLEIIGEDMVNKTLKVR